MIEKAVEGLRSAGYSNGDDQQVYQNLKQGRCDVCGQLSFHLINQVGKYLGEHDLTIKAVYQLAPESQVGVQPQGRRGR